MAETNILLPVTFGEPGPEGPAGPAGPAGPPGGGGGGLTLPSGDPTIIGSNGTALVAITDAVALTGSDLAVPFQRADGTFGQGVCTNSSLPYNDGSGLASANLANSIGISDFGELVVIGTVGSNDGDLQAAHTSYNFYSGSSALAVNRGRVGYAKCVSLTQAGGAVTEYFDWPDESGAVLDVRGVFVRNAARLRRSRTYEVSKVAGTLTVTAKAGGPIDEFTAIAGCDIVLFAGTGGNAGKLGLTTTPASAAGTVTNISKSIDGDLLMRPAT